LDRSTANRCNRRALPDLPAILDLIRQQPDREPHWLALADHLRNGDYDLSIVLRAHWPIYRQLLRKGDSIEQALVRLRHITVQELAWLAESACDAEERQLGDSAGE
jgi:hypothetical protein